MNGRAGSKKKKVNRITREEGANGNEKKLEEFYSDFFYVLLFS